MKLLPFLFTLIFVGLLTSGLMARQTEPEGSRTKVQVYYFHPTERCPIDEAIEQNTVKLMHTDFAKETADGLLSLQVLNTDDPGTAKIAEQFDINTQALYVVRNEDGKEQKTNLTDFAFATAKNNPARFLDRLKEEILQALK